MLPTTESYERDRSERRFSRVLMWLVCAGATLGTLIALFSRESWIAELFSHYRFHYFLAQAMLLLVFLNTRRYVWLVATVILALPNAWYVGPYLLPVIRDAVAGAATAAEPQLLLVNLSYRNTEHDTLLDYVRDRQPDLLVLSEYSPEWHAVLQTRLDEYPHRLLHPRENAWGMAIYSRNPLQDQAWLDLGVPETDNLRVRVELAGQTLELFALHLYSPTTPRRAAWRNTQLERVASILRDTPYPRIVVGDLNLTPFSPHFGDLLNDTGLLDARRRHGLHVTWPSAPVPLWIPIDHCLADVSAGVTWVRTGPNLGSDHYPLEITLAEVG